MTKVGWITTLLLAACLDFALADGSVRGSTGGANEEKEASNERPGASYRSSSSHNENEDFLHRNLDSNEEENDTFLVEGRGQPMFLQAKIPGSLGRLNFKFWNQNATTNHKDDQGFYHQDDEHRLQDGDRFLLSSLSVALGGSGIEKLVPWGDPDYDEDRVHVRFLQSVQGFMAEGAAIVVHANAKDGTIESINGELVRVEPSQEDLFLTTLRDNEGEATAAAAVGVQVQSLLEQALVDAGVQAQQPGEWLGIPELTVVRRMVDGTACLAWKRLYEYKEGDAQHMDMIFADATAGDENKLFHHDNIFAAASGSEAKSLPTLCAIHPMIMGSSAGTPSMETYDCHQSIFPNDCTLVSQSSRPIFTPDQAVNAAHNHAVAFYTYFWKEFGRDSLDDAGMTLKSRVHYGVNENNAFWRQGQRQVFYGDGDGVLFLPLSFGLDIVVHELCHGWTGFTSGLLYRGEAGALNEAMSDIFAALVEKNEKRDEADIWVIGEAVYTPGRPGDFLRSMKNPTSTGSFDFYPERYKLDGDYGGVHFNSGIANLAFYLLVKGGIHPRKKTSVVVPPIGYTNAAYIFYHANVNCLTPGSTFYMARFCTADVFGGPHSAAVHLAWDAVGVPRAPTPVIQLRSGVPVHQQAATYWEVLRYTMGPVYAGEQVVCATNGNNGDADLYVRWGAPAEIEPRSSRNACIAYALGSMEECTTTAAVSASQQLHVAVHAYRSFSNLSIRCRIIPANRPTIAPNLPPSKAPVVSQPTAADDISNDDPPSWI